MNRNLTMAVALLIGSSLSLAQNPLDTLGSVTANDGIYSNRIPVFTRSIQYTEVCFKDGLQMTDLHPTGGSTAGGNCEVGDTGWVVEADERPSAEWWEAKAECLKNGMRLPEPFEFLYSCQHASEFQLELMLTGQEWSSNATSLVRDDNSVRNGSAAPFYGRNGSCTDGAWSYVSRSDGVAATTNAFRCVK